MKKLVLLALLLLVGVTASAQYYDDAYGDASYEYVIDPEIDLTGEQWHLAGTSILAATNNLYLIIDGANRFVRTLRYFDRGYYERLWRCRIASYRPYYHNGSLGWYIVANLINYFLYPDGRLVRLSAAPCYYAYRYDVAHRHRLNFYNWHFWKYRPRPHYRAPKPYPRPVYARDYRHIPDRRDYRNVRTYRESKPVSKPVYRNSPSPDRNRRTSYRESGQTYRSSPATVKKQVTQRRSEYRPKQSSRTNRSSSASARQTHRETRARR